MKMRFLKNNWWILLIGFISLFLCVINISLAVVFGCSQTANLFTTISGWISGVATVSLGIIAYNQSRKYTVMSSKSDIKSDMRIEKDKLMSMFNGICVYSKLTECLSILVQPSKPSDMMLKLSYKMKVDEVKEKITEATSLIQMLKYCSKTIPSIVSKLNEMQLYVYKEYIHAFDKMNDDKELSSKINEIVSKCVNWIMEMVKLRNDALTEIDENITAVGKCKYVSDIESFNEKIDKEIFDAKNEVLKVINNQIAGAKQRII